MTDDELDGRVRSSILAEELDTSRIAAVVRNQIQTQRRPVRGWAVAAAALIALAAAGFSYRAFRGDQTPQLCIAAARDHEREVVNGEPRRWLSDLAAIQVLATKQGVPASAIAALGTTGYKWERGRLCFLKGHLYLHLVYIKDGAEYSVYLRPLTNEAPVDHSVREVSAGAEDSAYFQTNRLAAVFVAGHSHAAAAFARASAGVLQDLPS